MQYKGDKEFSGGRFHAEGSKKETRNRAIRRQGDGSFVLTVKKEQSAIQGRQEVYKTKEPSPCLFTNRFDSVFFSGWGKGGRWGAMPRDIRAFLDSRNISYIELTQLELCLYDKHGPFSGIYILSYWNKDLFQSGYHTIEVVCDGCGYTAYNWDCNSPNSFSRDSIFEFVDDGGLGVLSVFYIPRS